MLFCFHYKHVFNINNSFSSCGKFSKRFDVAQAIGSSNECFQYCFTGDTLLKRLIIAQEMQLIP